MEFMTYTAASQQGGLNMLWLRFGGAVMASTFFTVCMLFKTSGRKWGLENFRWSQAGLSAVNMASTFRFGTTSGPFSRASARTPQQVEESDEKGSCDPDKLLQCPFDKNHQIRACRFPYHLIKCRKNHPKLASELKTCPFNARHLVPKHELAHHTETCEDRVSVDAEDGGSTNGHCNWHVPVSTWVNPNMTEDWDKEADNDAAPFVWGVNTMLNQRADTKPTNNLSPGFRAPNTLPWS